MNHKTSESRTRIIPSTHSYTHSQQQQHPPHSFSPHANHDDRLRNPPKDETDTEKADRLLAATLLFYKEASTTSITNFSPSLSPLFHELQTFTQHHSLARQFVVHGDTFLEQRSARATLLTAPWEAEPSITILDFLFWTIVNLRKPFVSFKHSIEVRYLVESRPSPKRLYVHRNNSAPHSNTIGQCTRSVQCSDRVHHRRR